MTLQQLRGSCLTFFLFCPFLATLDPRQLVGGSVGPCFGLALLPGLQAYYAHFVSEMCWIMLKAFDIYRSVISFGGEAMHIWHMISYSVG